MAIRGASPGCSKREWLFGFENRDKVFEIDGRFKFNPVVIEKGGKTEAIRTAFMRRQLEDWEGAEALATPYTRTQVERFSPRSKAILEIQSQRDLEILEKIYANSVLLGDDSPNGWGIKYATEFHMTNDSKLFPPRPKWEEQGYRPDEYSRWLKGGWRPIGELWAELGVKPLPPGERRCAQPPYDTLPIPRAEIPAGIILSREASAWIKGERVEDVALPLYQGRMIWQADPARAEWIGPRASDWRETAPDRKRIAGQFLMSIRDSGAPTLHSSFRLGFRDVQNATNQRTFITALLPPYPCGNKVPLLEGLGLSRSLLLFSSTLSFQSDRALRLKMSQGTVNWFYAEEVPVLGRKVFSSHELDARLRIAAALVAGGTYFASAWVFLRACLDDGTSWRRQWAVTDNERVRVRALLDALNSKRFGNLGEDLAFLLKDCDLTVGAYSNREFLGRMDAKGFWRVDKDKDPELRHTVLTLVAFHDLEEKIRAVGGDSEKGIGAFLNQNDGEGWMLPETLRLADYGLGHDERAKQHQPVASCLGPRFYDWQLAQSAEESWRECHLHARNLLGEAGYQKLLADIVAEKRGEIRPASEPTAPPAPDRASGQGSLFFES